ncbi:MULTISPECIES: hypothetical protein [Caldilinea]|jgi:hypothetical protein|uniref:hypothetical protein n=1 Tax=Caldilinea TaxID=233191 RepID=UPI00031AF4BF|nr:MULTISPECIES: hypothetical protein [Caldilinea]MBO9391636.1 hypothetical protein [Caldilinea sp.]GIV74540.1 MAG: hypothetical protein KatS3mg049_3096 [Caldilinea sp.]
MKRILLLLLLLVGSVVVWRLGERLSADALGMAIGIVLGVLASIPASLMIVASGRRREEEDEQVERARPEPLQPLYQPPVIVLAGHSFAQGGRAPLDLSDRSSPWSQTRPQRRFKLVGEEERWIE